MRRGLLINCTHDFALRLLPPFIITRAGARISQALELVLATTPKQASASDSGKSANPERVALAAVR